jgi:hypothetical protein
VYKQADKNQKKEIMMTGFIFKVVVLFTLLIALGVCSAHNEVTLFNFVSLMWLSLFVALSILYLIDNWKRFAKGTKL